MNEEHVPLILLGLVLVTAVAGLALALTNNPTGEVTVERQCSSVWKNAVNCLDQTRGGCPKAFPPLKQYGLYIDHMPTCCCVQLKSETQNFQYGQSLYR